VARFSGAKNDILVGVWRRLLFASGIFTLPSVVWAQAGPDDPTARLYFAVPPSWGVKWDFDITNKLTLLSGDIFVYASIDYWFGVVFQDATDVGSKPLPESIIVKDPAPATTEPWSADESRSRLSMSR
jgi:hypothetical protein